MTAAEVVLSNVSPIDDLIGLVLTENKVYKGCHSHHRLRPPLRSR